MAASTPIALITGTSSGVGAYLAALLGKQHLVYATMRNTTARSVLTEACVGAGVSVDGFDAVGPVTGPGVRIRALDVATDSSVNECVEKIYEETGGVIDVCVNNAGYALAGCVELLSLEEAHAQFETNFFGVLRVTKKVLPKMRERQQGKMIVVSSVGGINGVPFNDIYCASKFAVEGLYESMAALYKAFNVWVTIVEPGPILTNFLSNAVKQTFPTDDDHPTLAKLKALEDSYRTAMMEGFKDTTTAQTGEQVAQHIIDHVVNVATPTVRVQTNSHPNYVRTVAGKLVDPTGTGVRDMMYQRFFAKV